MRNINKFFQSAKFNINEYRPKELRALVIGNNHQDKSALLTRYVGNTYSENALSRDFCGSHVREDIGNGKQVSTYVFSDCINEKEHPFLRSMTYKGMNTIIMLYSVKNDYENIFWEFENTAKQLKQLKIPYILVCGDKEKREMNEEPESDLISYEQGAQLAQHIGAAAFFECSIAQGVRVRDIFREAALIAQISQEVEPLIECLKKYAHEREQMGNGFKHPWKDLFGGQPGSIKVRAARGLIAKLTQFEPQRKFSQEEIDTLTYGNLGEIINRYPGIVYRLNTDWKENRISINQRSVPSL